MTVELTTAPAPAAHASEAAEFIRAFHSENPAAGPPGQRLGEVLRAIDTTGTYWHTPAELAYACRVAWRNSSKCIGRLYWRSLRVCDRRNVTTAGGVAAECIRHLREATNGGRIRPLITVFAPDVPGHPGPRIWNAQLIRYAGYPRPDGAVTGDPLNVSITELARRLGWIGSGGSFDILPLIIQAAREQPQIFEIPPDAILEVPLAHPDHPWFAGLGLRWHAVPIISDMFLAAGGIRYPCAPFNGWYMGTEVGSRNLGDADRYDKCLAVATRMGLNTAAERSLWRDRALVELNTAVLHSFDQAGVTVTDHHTESERFLTHLQREESAGRLCPADWSWIVPPLAGSACRVFHRYYDNPELLPGFFRHLPSPRPCPPIEAPMSTFHSDDGSVGERVLQERCGSTGRAARFYRTQVLGYLNERMQEFVAAAEMTFIATADGAGQCDCSFRAGPPGFIKVLDAETIAFPDYRGNGVLASLGNMLQNPHVGLLILDFVHAHIGLHINGAVYVLDPMQTHRAFPALTTEADPPGRPAEHWVMVEVEEAYIHCRKHLPRYQRVPQRRDWGTDDPHRKGGDYFGAATSPRLTAQP